MSLDEAIKYYSHLADECRRKANIERYDYMDLKDLAAEHEQLADWLNELKVLREKIQKLLEKQETAKIVVGKSRGGVTLWHECNKCGEPVDAKDMFCSGCGRKLILLPEPYTEEEHDKP